jgi:hypothetical protein
MNTEFAVGEVFAVWAAYHGSDKGYGPKIGTFSTVCKAAQAASGKGWYGGDGDVVEQTAIMSAHGEIMVISERSVGLDGEASKRDASLKEETLANLTPEQRRVLGF